MRKKEGEREDEFPPLPLCFFFFISSITFCKKKT